MKNPLQPFENACLDENCSERLCQKLKQELSVFSFFSESDIDDVSPYFNCRKVKAGDNIWVAGESCNYIAFIVSGRVQIKVNTEFPGKQVVVGVFSRGAATGVSCAVTRQPRNSTARVMEDAGLILLTRENFEKLIEIFPSLGVKLLQGMLLSETTRLNKAYARLASIF